MKAIYGIVNKINGKKYIGSAVNFYKRKREHLNSLNKNQHHSSHLQRSWNKYGITNFEFIILERVDAKQDLIPREQWWLDNSNNEYNVCKTAGSTLGKSCSDTTKKKISDILKGKISSAQIQAQLKRRKPVDQYDLLGNFIKSWKSTQDAGAFLGKNHKRIIEAACGKSNSALGFRWAYQGEILSDDIRTDKKKIYQFDINNNFIKEWYSISDAAIYYSINSSNITDCAKGKQKTSANFIWRYQK